MTESQSVLPPWFLNGQLWTFPITRPLFGKGKLDLPAGTYPEGTELHLSDKEEFVGGLGMMMLLRYRETPVGPYDELVYIPGFFSSPSFLSSPKELRSLRITAIYVSTQASVDSGRFNWNIPKHLAHFVFNTPPDHSGRTVVTISHTSTSPRPFFKATLTPSTYLTPFDIPIRTIFAGGTSLEGYSPLNDFVQPPLVPAPFGRKESEWMRFRGKIVGNMKGCWIEGGMPEREDGGKKKRRDLGDGKATTRGPEVWRFGAFCEEATLVFGESETLVIE